MDPFESIKHNELSMMKQLTATKARYAQQHWNSYDKVTQAEMILSDHPEWVNYQSLMEDYNSTYNNLVSLEQHYINKSSTD